MEDNALKTEYDAVGNVINPVTPASPVAPVKDTKTSFSPEQQAQYDKTLAMFSTPTIPVDNLQNVVPPPTLPTPPTTTQTGGALVNPPPEPTPAPEAEKVTLKQQLEKGIAGLFGNKIDTSAEKERLQIEEKEKKSRDQYNRITQLDQNYKKQVEEIEKNAQGGLESGMNAEINRLNKDYARTRADEMISYNILQGDYQAAEKTLADYKTDLQDQRKWEADTLQMAWNFVQNDLTESEKLEILQAFDEKKSKEDFEQQKALLDYKAKIDASTGAGIKAPTIQKINGQDMQWDAAAGTWVKPSVSTTTGQDLTKDQLGISSVDELLNAGVGADTAIGTSFLSRSTGFWGNLGRVLLGMGTGAATGAAAGSVIPGAGTAVGAIVGAGAGLIGALSQTGKQMYSQLSGAEQEFIGSVEQLTSRLTKESLISAKEQGATFGALSEGEMNLLAQSATKIGKWARKDEDGNVVGYNVNEKAFKKELQTINNMAKLDYLKKGGKAEDIGVNVTTDGKMWVQNWEGKIEEIKQY